MVSRSICIPRTVVAACQLEVYPILTSGLCLQMRHNRAGSSMC